MSLAEGASKYEAQHRPSETEKWTALPENGETSATYSPEGAPACGLWPRWSATRETDTGATVQSRYYVCSLD